MVTMAGSPSGMAATARLTAVINMEKGGFSCKIPMQKMRAQIASAPMPSCFPVCSNFFCKGVMLSDVWESMAAILPISVSMPVAVTSTFPLP